MVFRYKLIGLFTIAAAFAFAEAFVHADPPPQEKAMEALWADLEKPEPQASRALLKLADKPDETVAFLKGKMKPLKIRPGEIRALLLKLGSDQEETWKAAFEELDYFDPRLAIDLETLMAKVTETPARQRMVVLLGGRPVIEGFRVLSGNTFDEKLKEIEGMKIDLIKVELRKVGRVSPIFSSESLAWPAELEISKINSTSRHCLRPKWTRAVRAIVLLGHIGTPEAVAILREMATGHPEAEPTRVALEMLKRPEKSE